MNILKKFTEGNLKIPIFFYSSFVFRALMGGVSLTEFEKRCSKTNKFL